jgi:K+-sensing histidine kinase KdpD
MTFDEIVFARRSVIIATALAVPFLVCAAVAASGRPVPDASVAVGLVLVIVAAAATGLRSAGVGAALSSALWFDYFLTEPYDSFRIDGAEDVQVAVLLLLVGIAVTELALFGQRQRALLGRERGYLDGVAAAAESVADDVPAETVVSSVADRVREVLRADRCVFVPGTALPAQPRIQRDGTLARGEHLMPVDRSGLPTDQEVVLPVGAEGQVVGWFAVTAATRVARPTVAERRVAVLLVDQAAAALQHHRDRPVRSAP